MTSLAPVTNTDKMMEEKILRILESYPKISPSMLQISLGSGVPTDVWRPTLERLIGEGKVYRYTQIMYMPSGKQRTSLTISLHPDPSDNSGT